MRYLTLWPFLLTSVLCFNLDTKGVDEIHINGSNGSYFGYTVLLQKGNEQFKPIVIVGAPSSHSSSQSGGAVYSCIGEQFCTKYKITASNAYSQNGNFLGSALDGGENVGDPFITCAPRLVKALGQHNYLKGWCYEKRNSSNTAGTYDNLLKPIDGETEISRDPSTGTTYYDYSYGQAGFDVEYLLDTKTVIIGAPGVKNWNGVMIVLNKNKQIIPKREYPIYTENFGYLGYKVTSARLNANRQIIWYVAGSPRGNNLYGKVNIYNSIGTVISTLKGYESGSYYGSSILAVDVNNDASDDIFVGAPMGAGTTWDEGYVYFYKKAQSKFENPIKLVGNRKSGARFGTSIVTLGDIDLDSYNDVAISAPYEDDGVGAVYVYMGSKTGITPLYAQRLSPLDFPGNFGYVRGFGQGLSRGVDIDYNGHNDLAIGAYKSNQVFIIKALSVIDYKLILEPNVTSISSGGMNVKFCVYYSQRSPTQDLKRLRFKIKLHLDYRVEGETNFDYVINATLSQIQCEILNVTIRKSPLDITPFRLFLRSEILQNNIIGKGDNLIEKSIPYSHGCGDDNVCQTKILVESLTELPNIVLGLNKEIDVNVSAENVGEPGYSCQLFMNISNVLELRDTRDCNLENSTYVCPFSSTIEQVPKEMTFKFDVRLTKPDLKQVKLNFEVKCLGENVEPDTNKYQLVLDVVLNNSPYIQGSSSPENFYFTEENVVKDVEVTHKFIVGNTGPSPVKLDVYLVLPVVKKGEEEIFEYNAEGSLNGIEVQCSASNNSIDLIKTYNISTLLTTSLNKTIVIDCLEENVDCLVLFCDGDYLYTSTETAEYNVKIKTKTKLLESHYHNELGKKDIIALISTAYLFNGTHRLESHSSTMIFASHKKPIPLWVYILAGILGIILLALLVFLLYKCHFFDRNYRDKLNDERLMDQHTDEADDNLDLDPVPLNDQTPTSP